DCVARVPVLRGTMNVRHAGTPDPRPTGRPALGGAQGTRLLTYLVGLDKTYEATIRLGRSTTTDDREGEPLGEIVDASGLTAAEISPHLASLRGDIAQVPPPRSAIQIDANRAYRRAPARPGRPPPTDAREGQPLGHNVDARGLTAADIPPHLASPRGDIAQVPSTVSAIKIDGKRAYARARAGEDVQLAARPVTVSR